MSTELPVVVLFTAGMLAVFGLLIGYFGRVDLIAGYDPETVTDEEGLAAFVGRNLLCMAGCTAVVAAVEYLHLLDSTRRVWLGYAIVVGGLSVWMALRAQQY